ncbi:MAG: ABC transporter ATP-binding protein [Rhizobiaceae bacterium]
MLEVDGLFVRYGAHPALNDVKLSVSFGEIVVILGANGAGKSSLLKAIAGTSEGDVIGTVSLDGTFLSGEGADVIVERGIAFVPEGRGIFGDLTVGENLSLGAYSKHARKSQSANLNRVYELFPKLKERNGQIARTMSGGEQQMVAIGRAMMSDPKILMLDEPSLGLSPLLCKELFSNLTKVRDTGIGVLMVEQNAKQSLAIADRGYLIENGAITGQNDAHSMLNDPAVQAAYLGGAAAATNAAERVSAEATRPADDVGLSIDGSKTFISLGGLTNSDVAPVSDEAISSMVSRASQTSQNIATPLPSGASTKQPISKPALNEIPTRVVVPVHDDPELNTLLRSFEDSAQRARSAGRGFGGKEATQKVLNSSTTARATEIDNEENLPTIPVFKKSTVEVYRRATDGTMQRVKR